MLNSNAETFMKIALDEAACAAKNGEIPVGAVLVKDGKIIAKAHNLCEINRNSTAHAEITVIEEGCSKLGAKWLNGCELYVTLEPCPMCAGAIINARLDRIIFGVKNPKAGAFGSVINLNSYPLNHKPEIICGVMEKESQELLSDFFKKKRM